jgi:hypothetical protein
MLNLSLEVPLPDFFLYIIFFLFSNSFLIKLEFYLIL